MEKGLNVLSLFDGKGCGKLALDRAGIKVNKYYASEIEPKPMAVAMKNHPEIIQVGDVTKLKKSFFKDEKIDLLIGGSPCQGFSFGGKQLNFEDSRSKLFFEYVRLFKALKPKYFLLENVKMKQLYQDIISDYLGVKPQLINSNSVSAQSRERLYWTNIPFLIKDQQIFIEDILEEPANFKSHTVDSFKEFSNFGGLHSFIKNKEMENKTFVFNYSTSGRGNGVVESRTNFCQKALTLTKSGYSLRSFTGVYLGHLKLVRELTITEKERLQTLPDDYTKLDGVSDRQREQMIGNGWTVNVVTEIFKSLGKFL